MTPYRTPLAAGTLTFVFGCSVVSIPLPGRVTLWDIARMQGSLPRQRYGDPIAITVKLDGPSHNLVHPGSPSLN